MTDPRTLVEPIALDHLRELAAKVPADRCIVELGVYRGDSLLRLAQGSRDGNNPPVYGIDPYGLPGAYPGRPQMVRRYNLDNMRVAQHKLGAGGFGTKSTPPVQIIRDFSVPAGRTWTGPTVGLLFIDALHREGAVLNDHAAWLPHLTDDSIVAFDDYCERFPGVMRAVERLYGNRFYLVGTRLAVARGR